MNVWHSFPQKPHVDIGVQLDSEELAPGDIFALESGGVSLISCDAILIEGDAIVDESVLTGESIPVSKCKLDRETLLKSTPRSLFGSGKHSLYAGTKLLRAKASTGKTPLAIVYQTGTATGCISCQAFVGFMTQKGLLIQSILYPKPDTFQFHRDSMIFIGILGIVSVIVFAVSLVNLALMGISLFYLLTRALDLITVVLPPALPATLSIGVAASLKRLKNERIMCINAAKINVASKVNRICFDKTGTLTEEGLKILGVVSSSLVFYSHSKCHQLLADNRALSRLLACCHSLRRFCGRLIGDPLEIEMFNLTEGLPKHHTGESADSGEASVLHEFEFSPELRRMSVLVRTLDDDGGNESLSLLTKGSPEVIKGLCTAATLPSDYDTILTAYTSMGYRVLACGHRQLTETEVKGSAGRRAQFECHLSFLGFIIFENKLKPETIPTLALLRQARLDTAMVTGDNVLTAISVARECHLISGDGPVFFPSSFGTDYMSLTAVRCKDIVEVDLISAKQLKILIACTGDLFDSICNTLNPALLSLFLESCCVFGRMSPIQKRRLVEAYQRDGHCICFCGDGANDCDALMAADVGISLSEAEASIAAPFTSQICDISCVVTLLRNGRSSIVTSFVSFKFMALYSFTQFTTLSFLYTFGSSLTDWQFIYMDLFLIIPFGILINQFRPSRTLSASQPDVKLISRPVLSVIFAQMALQGLAQGFVFFWTRANFARTSYSPDEANVQNIESTSLALFSTFIYVIQALVFSAGQPHRQAAYWPLYLFALLAIGVNCLMLFGNVGAVNELMQFVPIPVSHRFLIFSTAVIYSFVAFGINRATYR